jgi:Xaa-Pro aminopeptidase
VPETHDVRRQRLRAALDVAGTEAALVTRLVNVRYLTGFTGSNAALLVTRDGAVLATDGRYTTQAGNQAPDVELLVERECARGLVSRAAAQRLGAVAFEAHDVTVELHADLAGVASAPGLVPLDQ